MQRGESFGIMVSFMKFKEVNLFYRAIFNYKSFWWLGSLFLLCVCLTLDGLAAVEDAPANRVTREGLNIEFSATPLNASEIMDATTAEIAFRITDTQSGKPVQGLYPVVWMDIGAAFDAVTGQNLWQNRLGPPMREGFSASPVAVDGKIYFTNDVGQTFVLRAGREFQLLHVNDLGEQVLASPALVDGKWYWRTASKLLAVR